MSLERWDAGLTLSLAQWVKDWYCPCCGLSHCYGTGSIPSPGTSTCCKLAPNNNNNNNNTTSCQKKNNKKTPKKPKQNKTTKNRNSPWSPTKPLLPCEAPPEKLAGLTLWQLKQQANVVNRSQRKEYGLLACSTAYLQLKGFSGNLKLRGFITP